MEASVWFLRLDLHVFLGFECLVETFRIPAARHHSGPEFVDDDHFAGLDDVIHVALKSLWALSAWFTCERR